MTSHTPIRIVAAALVMLPLTLAAAEPAQPPAFEEADADGDGVVSMEEATAAGVAEAEAKREDINGDGELTNADWKFIDLDPGSGSANAAADVGTP